MQGKEVAKFPGVIEERTSFGLTQGTDTWNLLGIPSHSFHSPHFNPVSCYLVILIIVYQASIVGLPLRRRASFETDTILVFDNFLVPIKHV